MQRRTVPSPVLWSVSGTVRTRPPRRQLHRLAPPGRLPGRPPWFLPHLYRASFRVGGVPETVVGRVEEGRDMDAGELGVLRCLRAQLASRRGTAQDLPHREVVDAELVVLTGLPIASQPRLLRRPPGTRHLPGTDDGDRGEGTLLLRRPAQEGRQVIRHRSRRLAVGGAGRTPANGLDCENGDVFRASNDPGQSRPRHYHPVQSPCSPGAGSEARSRAASP
jgi:hypothetical protein